MSRDACFERPRFLLVSEVAAMEIGALEGTRTWKRCRSSDRDWSSDGSFAQGHKVIDGFDFGADGWKGRLGAGGELLPLGMSCDPALLNSQYLIGCGKW
jgi:hypothetical protein